MTAKMETACKIVGVLATAGTALWLAWQYMRKRSPPIEPNQPDEVDRQPAEPQPAEPQQIEPTPDPAFEPPPEPAFDNDLQVNEDDQPPRSWRNRRERRLYARRMRRFERKQEYEQSIRRLPVCCLSSQCCCQSRARDSAEQEFAANLEIYGPDYYPRRPLGLYYNEEDHRRFHQVPSWDRLEQLLEDSDQSSDSDAR